jgi:hypothetical protein
MVTDKNSNTHAIERAIINHFRLNWKRGMVWYWTCAPGQRATVGAKTIGQGCQMVLPLVNGVVSPMARRI